MVAKKHLTNTVISEFVKQQHAKKGVRLVESGKSKFINPELQTLIPKFINALYSYWIQNQKNKTGICTYEFCCKMVIFGFAPNFETISKICEDVYSYLKEKKFNQDKSPSPKKPSPKKNDKHHSVD